MIAPKGGITFSETYRDRTGVKWSGENNTQKRAKDRRRKQRSDYHQKQTGKSIGDCTLEKLAQG